MAETKLGQRQTELGRRQGWEGKDRREEGKELGRRTRIGEANGGGETAEGGEAYGGRKPMGQGKRGWERPFPPPQGSGVEARSLRPTLGL